MRKTNKKVFRKLSVIVAVFVAIVLLVTPIIGCSGNSDLLDYLLNRVNEQERLLREQEERHLKEMAAIRAEAALERERQDAALAAIRLELATERARVTELLGELQAERDRIDGMALEIASHYSRIGELEYQRNRLDH